jgi:Fe-S-cluster containining protein
MTNTSTAERFHVSLLTPAGQITTEVSVPTQFVPVTAIVPLLRSLGSQAQQLEEDRAREKGESVSCRKGCAACCRMLVPLSVPEVFALEASIERLPEDQRLHIHARLKVAKDWLQKSDLWDRLQAVSEAVTASTDETLEPLNQEYYALRMPCPFLEEEQCGIYEDRPAACRELLVTSPAELCQDLTDSRIRPIPLALRISTALGLLWAELTGTPPRLVPLPVAIDWATRHRADRERAWPGTDLFDKALDKLWRYLSQEFESRRSAEDYKPAASDMPKREN